MLPHEKRINLCYIFVVTTHHNKPPQLCSDSRGKCSCVCELLRMCVGALLHMIMSCVVAYIVPWCVCHELVNMSNVCVYVVRSYVCLCVFCAFMRTLCVCREYVVRSCICRAFVRMSCVRRYIVCMWCVRVYVCILCARAYVFMLCVRVYVCTAMVADIIRPRAFLWKIISTFTFYCK